MYHVPHIWSFVQPESWGALMSCSREYHTVVRSFVTMIIVSRVEQVKDISSTDWPRLAVVAVRQKRSNIDDVPLAAHDNIWILAALHLCNDSTTAQELVLLIMPLQPGEEQGSHAVSLQESGQAALQYLRANWQHVTDLTIQYYQLDAVEMGHLLPSGWPEFSVQLNSLKVAGLQLSKEAALQVAQEEESVNHTQLPNWTDSENVIVAKLVRGGVWEPHSLSSHATPMSDSADLLAMDAAAWPGIVDLCLKDVCFNSSAISALATANAGTVNRVFMHTKRFDARFGDYGRYARRFGGPCWPQLHDLDLQCNAVGAGGIAALVAAFLPDLHCLNLSQNQLTAQGGRLLAQGSWPRLKELDIGENAPGDVGMLCVARGQWPKLTELKVNRNNVTDKGLLHLRKASWPKLRSLKLEVWEEYRETTSVLLWRAVFYERSKLPCAHTTGTKVSLKRPERGSALSSLSETHFRVADHVTDLREL